MPNFSNFDFSIFEWKRHSSKIHALALYLKPDELYDFAVFLRKNGENAYAQFVIDNKRNIEKLSAYFLIKAGKKDEVTIAGLQGSAAIHFKNVDLEKKTLKPGGKSEGYIAPVTLTNGKQQTKEEFLIKVGSNYENYVDTVNPQISEILSIKEAYAAEIYAWLSGHTFIDYKLLLSPNTSAHHRFITASKWLNNAEEFNLKDFKKTATTLQKVQFAEILIISLVLGDFDVHEANILKIKTTTGLELTRIDFGCALGVILSVPIEKITPKTVINFYNTDKELNTKLDHDFFTEQEIETACKNITRRVKKNLNIITEIAGRYETLLDQYRGNHSEDNATLIGKTSAEFYRAIDARIKIVTAIQSNNNTIANSNQPKFTSTTAKLLIMMPPKKENNNNSDDSEKENHEPFEEDFYQSSETEDEFSVESDEDLESDNDVEQINFEKENAQNQNNDNDKKEIEEENISQIQNI